MLFLGYVKRAYGPEDLRTMSFAFDTAYQRLPDTFKGNERVRRKLALLIIRHVDEGENDPVKIADAVILLLMPYFTSRLTRDTWRAHDR